MKHELKKLPNSAVELKISLSKEDTQDVKNQILNEMQNKVEIAGFRKGKAPLDRIEQEYKENVVGQLVEKMLDKYYDQVIKEENIVPISYISDLKTDLMKTGELDIVFNIDVYPEIQLGEYKNLEAEKENFTMNDDVLNKEIDLMLNSKAKLENTETGYQAKLGDTVDLAFEGFVDNVPFEGGKSDSHILKLGSKMFIDTFEDQLVGYTAGQEGEVNVKFPENYNQKNLAGKPATFKVKINNIKKLIVPQLTDEIAKEFKYDSIDDLKAKKYEEVKEREERRVEAEYSGKLLDKVTSNTKVELPFSMIAGEIRNRINEMERQLSTQGIGMDMYLKMTGMDIKKLEQQIAPIAAAKVKADLVLDAIAKKENIQANEEEITSKMTDIAKYYNMELPKLEDELKKNNNLDAFKDSVKAETIMEKAMKFIVDSAKK